MGGTGVECSQHSIGDNSFTMKCYDGNMSVEKAKYGILSNKLDKQTYCRASAIDKNPANALQANCTKYMASPDFITK